MFLDFILIYIRFFFKYKCKITRCSLHINCVCVYTYNHILHFYKNVNK